MAVIVKEINMPSNCDDCEFCIKDWDYKQGFCSASTHIQWSKLMLIPSDRRHSDCPLIEIPNGTRLIDGNNKIKVQSGTACDWLAGKMSYKEYSIYEIIKSCNPEIPVFFSEEESCQ